MIELKNITAVQMPSQLTNNVKFEVAPQDIVDIEIAEEEDLGVDIKAPIVEENDVIRADDEALYPDNTELIDASTTNKIPDNIVFEEAKLQPTITNNSNNIDAESGEEEENIEEDTNDSYMEETTTPESESGNITEETQQPIVTLPRTPKKRKKINPLILGAGIFVAIKLFRKL